MTLKFTILGCGSSGGVPRVGQGWGACDPSERATQPPPAAVSLLVQRTGSDGVTTVLVDASPDLREQLLDVGVTHVDAPSHHP